MGEWLFIFHNKKKVIYLPMDMEIILNVSSPRSTPINISSLITTIKKNKRVYFLFNVGLNISQTSYFPY